MIDAPTGRAEQSENMIAERIRAEVATAKTEFDMAHNHAMGGDVRATRQFAASAGGRLIDIAKEHKDGAHIE